MRLTLKDAYRLRYITGDYVSGSDMGDRPIKVEKISNAIKNAETRATHAREKNPGQDNVDAIIELTDKEVGDVMEALGLDEQGIIDLMRSEIFRNLL